MGPVADELNLMLCTLYHIKAPLYGQCVVCLSGTAGGHRKQISFLDLGPSFPSTLHPSSSLPLHLATSRVPRMTARLRLSSTPRIYSDKKLVEGWRMQRGKWSQLDVAGISTRHSNIVFVRHFHLEIQEENKNKGLTFPSFCFDGGKIKETWGRIEAQLNFSMGLNCEITRRKNTSW